MTQPLPRISELPVPAHWLRIDFISDLHLQPSEPATFRAWADYIAGTRADALFILGDLFEVWIGDDVLDEHSSFESECTRLLHAASVHRPVFFLHGNRDFLLGTRAAQACGMTLLSDPTVLICPVSRWLLSHGDALCLGDGEYQKFRSQVRTSAWQQAFLSKPLSERRLLAQHLRAESESRKRSGAIYADVDADEAGHWLRAADAQELIHGHTHQPADHRLPTGEFRRVLSDWDVLAQPARMEVLRLHLSGSAPPRFQRMAASDAC